MTMPGPPAPGPGLQVLAATLEYLSMLPSPALLFEILPLNPARFRNLAECRVICLPLGIRMFMARLCPGYDAHLKTWPDSALAHMDKESFRRRRRVRLRRLIGEGRYLDAYEYWWACRRPATRRRLTMPLYTLLGGDNSPFSATMGVFAWSGLLHAIWYPLLPVYVWLSFYDLSVTVLLSLWSAYTFLGFPIAINKEIRRIKGRKQRTGRGTNNPVGG